MFGHIFATFLYGQTQLGGLFSDFFFGDNFFLWADLRDLFGGGHTSRISLVFFYFKKHLCHKAFLRELLNSKHLGMLK